MSDKEYWIEKLNDYLWATDDYDDVDDKKLEQVAEYLMNDREMWNFIENIMDYYLTHPSFKEEQDD